MLLKSSVCACSVAQLWLTLFQPCTVVHQAPLSMAFPRQEYWSRWVAIPFSRGSLWPRDWTQISGTADRFFTTWANRKSGIKRPCKMVFFFPAAKIAEALAFFPCSDSLKRNSTCRANDSANEDNDNDNYSNCHQDSNGDWYLSCASFVLGAVLNTLLL